MENEVDQEINQIDTNLDPELAIKINPTDINFEQLQDRPIINNKHHRFRCGLLAVLISGSLLILGRSLVDGNIGKPNPFVFPDRIEFTQEKISLWPSKSSEAIIDTKDFYGKPKYLFGQRYKYLLGKNYLDIDLRYAIGTDGNIPLLLKELGYIKIDEDLLQKSVFRNDSIGYYAAFTYQNRAYLTACINPRGISTVTKEQFEDNASDSAMNQDVLINWLLGKQDLRDRRCLWTLISTPLTMDSDLKEINQKLESVWVLWHEWWKIKFPQP